MTAGVWDSGWVFDMVVVNVSDMCFCASLVALLSLFHYRWLLSCVDAFSWVQGSAYVVIRSRFLGANTISRFKGVARLFAPWCHFA